jgi:hypothetical protein
MQQQIAQLVLGIHLSIGMNHRDKPGGDDGGERGVFRLNLRG